MQAAGRFDGRAIGVRVGSGWAKVAGVGAIVAAAGFVVSTIAEHARQPGAAIWRLAPGWWGRQDLIGAVVVVVLTGCGVALLLRPPTARAAALVLAPAGALAAIFVSVTGLEEKAGTSRLAVGHWASVATAGGSVVCALAAALWLARARWVRASPRPPILLVTLTGVVSAGLGVAGLLRTRYAGAGSVLHHVHGWYWISNIGVLVVVAAAPLAAALLSRVSPTAPIALGAALASLLLDRLFTSRVLLLARPFHPEAGWWLTMGGALACVIEAVVIAGPRQSDPYDAQRPRGGRHSVRRP